MPDVGNVASIWPSPLTFSAPTRKSWPAGVGLRSAVGERDVLLVARADPHLEVTLSRRAEDVDPPLDDDPGAPTPSVSTPTRMPGAPVPSRSVQNGARMLFGRAGFGIVGQVAAVVVLGRAAAGDQVAVGVDPDAVYVMPL